MVYYLDKFESASWVSSAVCDGRCFGAARHYNEFITLISLNLQSWVECSFLMADALVPLDTRMSLSP